MISTVYIAKNVYGGDGLGRLGDGRVVFVPGAWAGEQVRAEIVEEKKHFVKARLVEVVEASPERRPESEVEAEKPLPGMTYAGLSYKGECAVKEQQLREFFERARISVPNIMPFPHSAFSPLHYRNKVVYHFERHSATPSLRHSATSFRIGYRTEPSHEIVDVTEDPLAVKEINAKLPEIRRSVMTLLTTGPEVIRRDTERKGNVTVRWTPKSGVKWWIGEPPKGMTLKETTCGLDFEVPADGFYQVNPAVGEELAKEVVAAYRKGADVAPEVLDLYCGVGVFGLCCLKHAPSGARLTGIESGRQAIDFAKKNAESIFTHRCSTSGLQPSTCRFYSEEVGRNLRRISVGPRTTVIVDPPRDGMEPNVPKWLADSKAPRILCVSCDPATLMRDLKTICRTYDVESVRWFNMFPRTARFETLVVLTRKP